MGRMKAVMFWLMMFGMLGGLAYMTMHFNPQRPVSAGAANSETVSDDQGRKIWKRVYAELYGPQGLERTWKIATPKGYFNESDRDEFLRKIPAEKRFGEARLTVKEDRADLVFGIYYKGAKP